MSRPIRIEYPGAVYHVTDRGNNKQDIFIHDSDRITFLSQLELVLKIYNWICHGYCLMDNHYHLLIETPEGNLSAGMKQLNSVYAQKFNKTHDRVGHVFQGRFKSFVIEKEGYLLNVLSYMFLNPVRAGFVECLDQWPWSSYLFLAGENVQDNITSDWILGVFSEFKKSAQEQFREFVLARIDMDSPFERVGCGNIIGSDQFIHHIRDNNKSKETIKEIPRKERYIGRPSLSDLFFDIRNINDRNKIIIFARERCGYLNVEIAKHLNISQSLVSMVLSGEK